MLYTPIIMKPLSPDTPSSFSLQALHMLFPPCGRGCTFRMGTSFSYTILCNNQARRMKRRKRGMERSLKKTGRKEQKGGRQEGRKGWRKEGRWWTSLFKVCLFVYVISTPNVGLEPMTLRSRVTFSSDWVSQAPLNFYLSYKTHVKISFLFEAFLYPLATCKHFFLRIPTVLFPYLH